MNWLTDQLIQLMGSALILAAFIGAQTGRLDQKSRRYLLANALGSTALAIDAAYFGQWGFLLLEGSWAIVSLLGVLSAALSARTDPDRSAASGRPDRGQLTDELSPVPSYHIEVDDHHVVYT